ncbi:porin [Azohydromonas lata]|uniref:Porin n=1 Tax=Azohydromonas lata TaxID=45677 RepID=A0ABU5IAP4_9BURK|nr:porin [Azohydromonas lata]MDZ5456176.1 porin [Azohydromonas lata]
MNKKTKAAWGLALGAASMGGAWAQSGVTLSGIADSAVRHVRNEDLGGVTSLVSGSNATSRFIFRGTEDLGGGLSAGFHLESGVALDTGANTTANTLFDRRATLSLASKQAGELRLGRDYVPSYTNWVRFDPFSHVGVAASANFVSATPVGPIKSSFGASPNTTTRTSNAVQWLMPAGWGGLEGGLMWASDENGTAANGQHKVKGARLGYAAGPLVVSGALTRTENNLTTAGHFDDRVIAALYDFGMVRVSLALRRFEQADARQNNVLLGAWIPVGNGEIKASLQRVSFSGSVGAASLDDNHARQLGLGYVHNLSKRTALYGTLSHISNSGALAYAISGGASGLAAGGSSRGVEFGMRHNF